MIALKRVNVEEIYLIRRDNLRQGMPMTAAQFDGDGEAMHFAAYDGGVVGCVSVFHRSNAAFGVEKQMQMRGLAVDVAYRGQGIATSLIRYAEAYCYREQGAELIWLNSRVSARGLYEKEGYTAQGEVFDIESAGEHIVMYKAKEDYKSGCCR